MNFRYLAMSLYLIMFSTTLSVAAVEDIENRFIYSDYSKKISINSRDTSLTDVLKIFSQQAGLNFISAAEVSNKKVTIFLEKVPTEEALEKILDANDLTYEMTANSNVFIVKPKEKDKTVTKVFPLKFASVSTSKMNGKDATGGIKAALDAIKSKDGKLQEDPRTNSFIISDVPEQFPLIEETIAKLDVPVVQILIEVEILDVSKGNSEKIGVLYGQTPLTFRGGSRETLVPFNQNFILNKMNNGGAPYKLASGSDSSDSSSGGSGSSSSGSDSGPANSLQFTPGILDFSGMTAALDFLKSQADTHSLASPKILTLNNQTGHIEVGGDRTVGVSATESTSTTGTTKTETAITKPVKVMLDVTPQANLTTGEIVLKVSPQIDDTSDSGIRVNGTNVIDVESRKTDSILKVKNGETVIIGGLLRKQRIVDISKLPFLGDLPVIGGPFRHKSVIETERELIIFITPKIANDNLLKKFTMEASQRIDREGMDPLKMDAVNQQLDSTEKNNK